MQCPKCKTQKGIKWFLRHQSNGPDDTNTNANCITILCTECGNNESYLLEDLLDTIFKNWSEFFKIFNKNYLNFDIIENDPGAKEDQIEENDTEGSC